MTGSHSKAPNGGASIAVPVPQQPPVQQPAPAAMVKAPVQAQSKQQPSAQPLPRSQQGQASDSSSLDSFMDATIVLPNYARYETSVSLTRQIDFIEKLIPKIQDERKLSEKIAQDLKSKLQESPNVKEDLVGCVETIQGLSKGEEEIRVRLAELRKEQSKTSDTGYDYSFEMQFLASLLSRIAAANKPKESAQPKKLFYSEIKETKSETIADYFLYVLKTGQYVNFSDVVCGLIYIDRILRKTNDTFNQENGKCLLFLGLWFASKMGDFHWDIFSGMVLGKVSKEDLTGATMEEKFLQKGCNLFLVPLPQEGRPYYLSDATQLCLYRTRDKDAKIYYYIPNSNEPQYLKDLKLSATQFTSVPIKCNDQKTIEAVRKSILQKALLKTVYALETEFVLLADFDFYVSPEEYKACEAIVLKAIEQERLNSQNVGKWFPFPVSTKAPVQNQKVQLPANHFFIYDLAKNLSRVMDAKHANANLLKNAEFRGKVSAKQLNFKNAENLSALYWLTFQLEGIDILIEDPSLRNKIHPDTLNAITSDGFSVVYNMAYTSAAHDRFMTILMNDKVLRDKINSQALNTIITTEDGHRGQSAAYHLAISPVGREVLLLDNARLLNMITEQTINSILPKGFSVMYNMVFDDRFMTILKNNKALRNKINSPTLNTIITERCHRGLSVAYHLAMSPVGREVLLLDNARLLNMITEQTMCSNKKGKSIRAILTASKEAFALYTRWQSAQMPLHHLLAAVSTKLILEKSHDKTAASAPAKAAVESTSASSSSSSSSSSQQYRLFNMLSPIGGVMMQNVNDSDLAKAFASQSHATDDSLSVSPSTPVNGS